MMSPAPKDIQITLRLPGELAQLLDQHAERTRTNRSWVIRDALHQYFSRPGENSGNNGPNKA
ncbi:MAG: CopG family transcriptional regulator [Planctomycetes bacterium]|nr:CopG family transcriptional regulator [Planctomycetota bacterium]MCB9936532.1 CopG family transcriptional regulator [Planctomycetota bacterium]